MSTFPGELPCLEPPMAHASSIEDIELTDEDEEVDILKDEEVPTASLPDEGKEAKFDSEMNLLKSNTLIKVKKITFT